MTSPALEIIGLRKTYRNGTEALKGVSLSVGEGEFFGVLGPNGAGKSTLIHCVTGIANLGGGTIRIFGHDVVKDYREARRMVGLSPQEFDVDHFASGRNIVDWMGGYFGMPKALRRQRLEMLVERFALQKHIDKPFRSLSGGLKRRVILARALIHDPKLLILDEPTAGVDVELRMSLWNYLVELNRDGKTILLTSHYLEEVEKLCDTIAIIHDGRIVRRAPKEEFLAGHDGLESAYLAMSREAVEVATP